jgi:hydrogenase expression/formation protein HypD
MKHVTEYRDGRLARSVARRIAAAVRPNRRYRFMEFCGGHTHAIYRYGLSELLPDTVEMIHGPGCPVCVLPMARIDSAIALARRPDVILCSYGDMLRVPGSNKTSLMKARADGADIRMVYSPLDALKVAQDHPDREVVFFAIGFETTTPPTALAIKSALDRGLRNFSVFCNHVLTPPAMGALLAQPGVAVDGFVGPGHVSTIIGSEAFAFASSRYGKPVVVSGFEPLDMLRSIELLIRQLNEGRARVENEYRRAVPPGGNRQAQALMDEVFERRGEFEWRGLGVIPDSALRLRETFAEFDAERRFEVPVFAAQDHKACECAQVLRGVKRPADCKVFATACTPDNPLGACMVSSEGACAAYYAYGRHQPRRAAS